MASIPGYRSPTEVLATIPQDKTSKMKDTSRFVNDETSLTDLLDGFKWDIYNEIAARVTCP